MSSFVFVSSLSSTFNILVGMPGYAPGPPVFQTGASTKLASFPKKNSGSF